MIKFSFSVCTAHSSTDLVEAVRIKHKFPGAKRMCLFQHHLLNVFVITSQLKAEIAECHCTRTFLLENRGKFWTCFREPGVTLSFVIKFT